MNDPTPVCVLDEIPFEPGQTRGPSPREQVRARTMELAVRAGRQPWDIRQSDYETSKFEFTGQADPEKQLAAIDLPAPAPARAAALPGAARPAPALRAGRRIRILVADDERFLRETVADILRLQGYDVLTAGDGLEAVEVFRAGPDRIDLVLTDLMMPGLDGDALIDELRKIRANVRVVVMSGSDARTVAARFLGKHIAGLVAKPFSAGNLMDALRAALAPMPPLPAA